MDVSLLEIRNAKSLMIDREWVSAMMPTVHRIFSGELQADKSTKRLQAIATMAGDGNRFVMSDHSEEGSQAHVDTEDAYLNVIFVEGLITRNGGACTYGSKQIRNLMMEASDDEKCKGHVLVIDTPGGLTTAIPDFKMAVDYAHEKGLKVDGIIDGTCASLGVYLGQMLNKLYYTSTTDRIGSVGVFAILDVMKNGDVDPTTGEKHYEIYDPESYDKNDWYRQLAEEEKADLLIEDLKQHGQEFRDFVMSRRPNAEEQHVHGKMFQCGDVDGILVDGQRTIQEVCAEVMESYYSTHQNPDGNTLTEKNSINMKEQFPALFAALQVEEMQMSEEGAFMNSELLATLNTAFEEKDKAIEALTNEKAELEQKFNDAESKNQELATKVSELELSVASKEAVITSAEQTIAAQKETLDANQKTIEEQATTITEREKQIAELNLTIASQEATINDQNATIEAMNAGAGASMQGGGAPQNNGQGVKAPATYSMEGSYDHSLSPAENKKRIQAYEKKQREQVAQGK